MPRIIEIIDHVWLIQQILEAINDAVIGTGNIKIKYSFWQSSFSDASKSQILEYGKKWNVQVIIEK